MKFLNIGDLHIGVKRYGNSNLETRIYSRIEDTINSLRSACSIAVKENVDFMAILGDTFDIKTPDNVQRELFINTISEIFDKIPVYIIAGNHDRESMSHALSAFKKLGTKNNVHIIDYPQAIKFKGYNLVFMPYDKNKSMIKYIESVKNLENSFLFGHFVTSNAVYSNEFRPETGEDVIPISLLEDSKFLATFIGHIHKRQKLSTKKTIVYVGSLVKWSFDEMNDGEKGATLVEVEGKEVKLKFMPIPDRKFFEIDYKEIDKMDVEQTKNAVIKIAGKCKVSDRGTIDIGEIRKKLAGKCFKVEDIKIEIEKEERDNSKNEVFTPLLGAKEALIKWAEINKMGQEFIDKGMEIINGSRRN